jgi:hypothetical protein
VVAGSWVKKKKPDDSEESSGGEFGACGRNGRENRVATTAPAD